MIEEHPLATLFHTYADDIQPPVIELLNINHQTVGALYLGAMKYKNLVISETNNSEKYYLYVDGVGVYFSFFKKLYSDTTEAACQQF